MESSTIALITSLLNSFGFPVVVCGALFWYIINRDKTIKEEREKTAEAQKEERAAFLATIDRNTEALNAVKEKISCK